MADNKSLAVDRKSLAIDKKSLAVLSISYMYSYHESLTIKGQLYVIKVVIIGPAIDLWSFFSSSLTLGMSLTCLEAYFSFSAKRTPAGARYNIPPKIGRMKYISLEPIFYAFLMHLSRGPLTWLLQ